MRREVEILRSTYLEGKDPLFISKLNRILSQIANLSGTLDYESGGNDVSINSSMIDEGYWIVSGGYPVHIVNINGVIGKKIYND